jgi:hypothetical protein
MSGPSLLRSYGAPPLDRAEILRYARAGGEEGELGSLLDEVWEAAAPLLSYRVAYRILPVSTRGDTVMLGQVALRSRALAASLADAREAILMAATVGMGIDRLLLRYGRLSPVRALLLQAIGAERVEALLSVFTAEREAEHGRITLRFSPGYGDLPLASQRELLPLLDAERMLGITLGETLLMSPTKSVTAIAGILGQDRK